MLGSLVSLKNNALECWSIPKVPESEREGFRIRGAYRRDHCSVVALYSRLNGGNPPNRLQRMILSLLGSKLCLVAVTPRDELVGFDFFYFTQRDLDENTVHEGYIGVVPERHGQGIGTGLREGARRHFQAAKLAGISSAIDVDNIASLASAMKAGFVIEEEFTDGATGRERYYLKLPLSGAF